MTQDNTLRILSSYLYARSLVPEDMPTEEILAKAILVRDSIQYLIVLLECSDDSEPEETLQSVFFEAGKLHFGKELRWWFEVLYNMLLKQKEGPRLGLIAKILTIHWIIDNLNTVMNDPWIT